MSMEVKYESTKHFSRLYALAQGACDNINDSAVTAAMQRS